MHLVILLMSQISTLCLTFVGLYLLSKKKFWKHPYRLIGVTCIAEASLYAGKLPIHIFTCGKLSIFGSKSMVYILKLICDDDLKCKISILKMWKNYVTYVEKYSSYLIFMLNCCLFIDL